ncbi:uncharacterized protein LOC127536542 isoform X3 [Acanthochromis polyacanthus]|uniref:uncharacterized protein LOC127536542 isoform X3 n=1 Tax=Acanthochromis polyacanthus TaxID=80966 RepID=UPI002234896A|nr:uncharacterized protein LOC127536542 isoform X3 [Acanthochromis polyacanthus]
MWFSDVLQVPIISRTAKLNTIQDSPSKGSVVVCMWQCKLCLVAVAGRLALLNHYKLKHPHLGRTSRYPCTFLECPCTFKTWNALHIHHSRDHSTNYKAVKALSVFKCHICSCKNLGNEREYFAHINAHLKKNEKVTCMFDGCDFHTSVYGTFRSHKSRRHASHSLTDFKPGIVTTNAPLPFELLPTDGQEDECVESDTVESANPEVLSSAIEKQLAAALLKLEYLVHVPGTAVDDFLYELNYLSSASVPLSKAIVADILKRLNFQVEDSVVANIISAVYTTNPISKAIEKGGPLSSSYQRKKYYRDCFSVVEPVTFILDGKKRRTFQYVPILKSLQQVLSRKGILDKLIENHKGTTSLERDPSYEYRSFKDGNHFQQNKFLNNDELRISVCLYVDDFETCNPLGTSRKKHKLCAVYWLLSNLPPGCHSSLSSIYLAVLCKSDDVKNYSFDNVLEPLLTDLKTLEDHGVYVPLLGTSLKGTVHSVVADNLGAHSIAGFIESFSGDYFCRFCTARSCEISSHCVASGVFNLRTKEEHAEHVQIAVENVTHHLAVKRECALTKNLSHFNVVTGYPPDIAHDIFEGIVPFELAYCLNFLIAKKFFTLDELNKAILSFPYKWSDKTNKPHAVPKSLSSRKSIGGNAHENWSLLRFLPFLIGSCVPQNEPAWVVLLDLKDITELVVAPVHTDESISYLESKIVEHRQRFQELFPTVRLLPKHHFLEHYPRLIRCFGPLLSVWTMRFEAKHKYFKQIVKHTSCFKNLPLTLASKHQFMIAFHISSPSYGKPCLDVPCVSTVPVDLLKDEVARAIHLKYPNTDEVNLAKNATYWGIAYSKGMIVAHGSACGLPEFAEIIQMCIIDGNLFVIVRVLCAWYIEHYRAFELRLSPAREVKLLALSELTDAYPLAAYMVGSSRMVTLKRHIHIKD